MFSAYRATVESALDAASRTESLAPLLCDSMRYALLDGGKRVRPCLLLAVCDMLGGTQATALPYACALEMIHCYSLVHDDLPAMDNDDLRRGKPSTHVKFGEANGILAGDGLLTAAALLLSRQTGHDAAKTAILYGALRMVSGQSDDLNATGRNAATLSRIHADKTGALFVAATTAGALLSDPDAKAPMEAFGAKLGLLFQMTDDLLDAERDAAEHKLTYVTLFGSARTHAMAVQCASEASAFLAPYHNAAADALRACIQSLINRTE